MHLGHHSIRFNSQTVIQNLFIRRMIRNRANKLEAMGAGQATRGERKRAKHLRASLVVIYQLVTWIDKVQAGGFLNLVLDDFDDETDNDAA
ncbi:hypothetical protein ACRALDRAFT_1094442 [Sodiomyces alcalophilus JCM 7366]|uniref:uncharacterized protein n=1 Tax=Sodiomyces alcalophilus JCM 7366 TaxID=591952 RepID=UPI0039B3F72E